MSIKYKTKSLRFIVILLPILFLAILTSSGIALAQSVNIVGTNNAPPNAWQGQTNILMETIDITNTTGDGITVISISSLKIDGLSGTENSDVTQVRLYLDNGDGIFNPASDTQLGAPAIFSPPPSVSATIGFSAQNIADGASIKLYVVFDISAIATIGNSVGAAWVNSSYFGFSPVPVTVTSTPPFPFQTGLTTITSSANKITVTPTDLAPATVVQGDTDIAIEQLCLQMNAGTATWNGLTVNISANFSDISLVKLYKDDDGTPGFNPLTDTLLISVAPASASVYLDLLGTGVAQTITTTSSCYIIAFDIDFGATVGNTVGITSMNETHFNATALVNPITIPVTPPNTATIVGKVLATFSDISPTNVYPGQNHIGMGRITLATSSGNACWNSLTVDLASRSTAPASDIQNVRLYRDNGDGIFDRTQDTQLGSKAGANTVTFNLAPEPITTTSKDYFVVFRILITATTTNKVGFRIQASDFNIDDCGVNPITPTGAFNFIAQSTIVAQTVNINFSNVTPNNVVAGETDVVMSKFTMKTNAGTDKWVSVTLDLSTPSTNVSDIASVKLYKDEDGDGVFSAGDTHLRTVSGAASVTLTVPSAYRDITTTPTTYFILFDISTPVSGTGNLVGFRVTAGNFTMAASSTATVTQNPDPYTRTKTIVAKKMHICPSDLSPTRVALGGNAVMGSFSIRLERGSPTDLVSFNIRLSGAGLSTNPDNDISSIELYKDNGNGVFDGDTLLDTLTPPYTLPSETFTLSETIDTNTSLFFIVFNVSPTATVNNTVGFRLGNGAAYFPTGTSFSPADIDNVAYEGGCGQVDSTALVGDLLLVTPTPNAPATVYPGQTDVLMETLDFQTLLGPITLSQIRMEMDPTDPLWTTPIAPDVDIPISGVKIYRDDGDNIFNSTLDGPPVGTSAFYWDPLPGWNAYRADVVFSIPQVISTVPIRYYVAFDIALSPPATLNNTVGARWGNAGAGRPLDNYFITSPIGLVDNTPPDFNSGPSIIQLITNQITVTPTDISPVSVAQGQTDVGMERLQLATGSGTATWTQLRVDNIGTLDSDVSAVKLYKDDGDTVFNPLTDTLLASGVFAGGTVTLNFAAQTITTTPSNYFVVFDIAGGAVIGNNVGARWNDPSYFTVTTGSVSTTNFPFQTALRPITVPSVINLTAVSLAPASTYRNKTIAMESLHLATPTAVTGTWSGLRIDLIGTGATDSDIAAIYIYKDDGTGVFDGADVLIGTGTFVGGVSNIVLTLAQTIDNSGSLYFVVYQISSIAGFGRYVGARWVNSGYFTTTLPVIATFPISSGTTLITYSPGPGPSPDTKPPTVEIKLPEAKDILAGLIDIIGTATDDNFARYTLYYGRGEVPSKWIEITGSTSAVVDDLLGAWDTSELADGVYTLRLYAIDAEGNTNDTTVKVIVDNTPPILKDLKVEAKTNGDECLIITEWLISALLIDPTSGTDRESIELVISRKGMNDIIVPYDQLIYDEGTGKLLYSLKGDELSKGDYTVTLKAKDNAGNKAQPISTTFKVEEIVGEARVIRVLNYPNPVKDGTYFTYTLCTEADEVKIEVFNIAGERVRTLEDAPTDPGFNKVFWDMMDDDAEEVANGLYFYRLTAKFTDMKVEKIGKIAVAK